MTNAGAPTVSEPLRDYSSLLNAIKKLPPPLPGRVRVFRGQNGNYPQMLATGSRGTRLLNSSLFNVAARVVAQNLIQEIDIDLELNMMLFLTQAVAQHYGPGSSYLDVTRSLDVALWFALHEYHPVDVKLIFGAGTALDPKTDIVRQEKWITYPRWEKTAYVYTFDVTKWKIGESLEHGHLIDLAEAPPAFSSSARMRAQSACLLASGLDAEKLDLSDCYAHATPPIPVAWPMTGAPKIDLAPEDLFPGPELDDWYKRFLSIPLVPQPDRSTPPQITMSHPLPVTVYLPQQQERARALMQCENGFHPPLVYPTLGNPTLETFDPVSRKAAKFALRDATVVVVESPLRFVTPPSSYEWNQGLLWTDISDQIPVFDAPAHANGSVPLQSVFVEFSPLETPSFSGAQDGTDQSAELVRAAWLVRQGSALGISLFIHSFPNNQLIGATLPRAAMDPSTGTIRYEARTNQPGSAEKVEWRELTEMEIFAKPVFTILLILRELSPLLKPAPFPALVVNAGTDSQKMMVTLSKESARLLRVKDSRTSRPLHFLRGLTLEESFVGGRMQGGLEFVVKQPYSKLDANWIRDEIARNAPAFEAAHANDPKW